MSAKATSSTAAAAASSAAASPSRVQGSAGRADDVAFKPKPSRPPPQPKATFAELRMAKLCEALCGLCDTYAGPTVLWLYPFTPASIIDESLAGALAHTQV